MTQRSTTMTSWTQLTCLRWFLVPFLFLWLFLSHKLKWTPQNASEKVAAQGSISVLGVPYATVQSFRGAIITSINYSKPALSSFWSSSVSSCSTLCEHRWFIGFHPASLSISFLPLMLWQYLNPFLRTSIWCVTIQAMSQARISSFPLSLG